MDWSGCEIVEVIPGKVSDAPIVKGHLANHQVTTAARLAGRSFKMAICWRWQR
jgi:hypothetical protein